MVALELLRTDCTKCEYLVRLLPRRKSNPMSGSMVRVFKIARFSEKR
jgi:hypothetical protein